MPTKRSTKYLMAKKNGVVAEANKASLKSKLKRANAEGMDLIIDPGNDDDKHSVILKTEVKKQK